MPIRITHEIMKETLNIHSSGHNLLSDYYDERRESAYKAVLIVSLCLSVISAACLGSIFPFFYYSLSISTTQIGSVLGM